MSEAVARAETGSCLPGLARELACLEEPVDEALLVLVKKKKPAVRVGFLALARVAEEDVEIPSREAEADVELSFAFEMVTRRRRD